MVMARALLLGAGLALGSCDEIAGDGTTAAACPADAGGARGPCTADGTGGLALLQGHWPQMGKTQLNSMSSGSGGASDTGKCTFRHQPPTPYYWDESCKRGGVGCNADGQHAECRWCGFGPYVACPGDGAPPLRCTPMNGDMWATGSQAPCCSGLTACLDLHGSDRHHYQCLPSCPGPTTTPMPRPSTQPCTRADRDPWASGSWTPCCGGLEQCLDLHGSDRHHYRCLPSCVAATTTAPSPAPGPSPGVAGLWRTSGKMVGRGWCSAQEPAPGWDLKGSCGGHSRINVLSYNLFWWNLFGIRKGNGGSAGKLIKKNGPFDILGFQECDDVGRVLRDAGLSETHQAVVGGHATAIAFMKSDWELLDSGREDVAEDRREQYYGRRGAGWVRLRHRRSGKVVFALNHHGPLPVNTGGLCGGPATGYNMLRIIGENAKARDTKLLMGDLNADKNSATQRALSAHMHRLAHDWVDAIFSSCSSGTAKNLGNGGSDHDALQVTMQI